MTPTATTWSPVRKTLAAAGLSALALFTAAMDTPAGAAPPPRPQVGAGTLDPAFGTGGTVVTLFPDVASGASGAARQGDAIIAAGGALSGANADFLLARYRADGRLDRTFGTGGQVVTPFNDVQGADGAEAVAVQPDRRIVAVGTAGLGTDSDIGFAVVRYRADGRLDQTFGGDGVVVTPVGVDGDAGADDVVIQRDGRIVVVGGAKDGSGDAVFAAARYLPGGALDPAFGTGGTVLINISGGDAMATAVALQADGKIVLAGTAIGPGDTGQQFAVVRLTDTGRPDPDFGGGTGIVVAQNVPEQGKGGAQDVVIDALGRIVVAGLGQTAAGKGAFGLMRFLPAGTLDPSFGGGTGKVLTEFAEGDSGAASLVLRRDGRIVAAGSAGFPSRFALAGYLADGSLDPAFGTCGRTTTPIGENSGAAKALLQGKGGLVLVGSTYNSTLTSGGFALARYFAGPGVAPGTAAASSAALCPAAAPSTVSR
ncbi:hypothetical protein Cs7R123_02040 [Catellatospora sp. TT07R-123]|uniref:hypothetical protein n=1 Tax=Catellatospora sp. TT07R-123 TaxID=2733863 RepID=UPI001B0C5596|nr:hypothetical protein [Catellatospora sp. TT07R-123]GHJ42862.1 hypothetical protein Cs7R123_02040 [Catellatospora sp. TT07R-123]